MASIGGLWEVVGHILKIFSVTSNMGFHLSNAQYSYW